MAAMLGAPAKAHGPEGQQQEKRKKESILDLTKFLEKPVRVKFAGNFYSLGLNSPLYRQSLSTLGSYDRAKMSCYY